jgi:8-amino-7-oxononanoate synthase
MDNKLIQKLHERTKEGTVRSLSFFDGMTDFYSNDYLGLARNPFVAYEQFSGSTGSRLISGSSKASFECEDFLAKHFDSQAALVFNSGYDANLGFFSAVPQKGDTILYDKLIHASVRDGIRLSMAKAFSFSHNSLDDLETKIRKAEGAVYVAVESLYSMDGDTAPLNDVARICKENNAYLVVDEAHATGVFGKGLVDEWGLRDSVFARIITFGKAYGAHGAVILCSEELKQFLINFARPFIYTTALPPSAYTLIQQRCMLNLKQLQETLQSQIALFRSYIALDQLRSNKHSPIQIVPIDCVNRTRELAEKLQSKGFAVKPIYSPTVPKGSERIRICIHSFNTVEEIHRICETFNLYIKTAR